MLDDFVKMSNLYALKFSKINHDTLASLIYLKYQDLKRFSKSSTALC